ncbi:MAG TPA: glycosyltransferase, partial [Herpetosiphonaceae bacterium]|nr:glycosyltransferase [Herpetosiphonaceae bacterium]
ERPDAPLIGVVSRLDDQKGIDLIVQALGPLIEGSDAQLMVLGSGYGPYEDAFRAATAAHPDRVANYIGFHAPLAQRVYAGADIFLMPSSFEPCGLSQMIAMRYGTIPVVRATGGLVDTVPDMSRPDGIGAVFAEYTVGAMLEGLARALAAYRQPNDWAYFVRRAMAQDFSWAAAAARYDDVYRWALTTR